MECFFSLATLGPRLVFNEIIRNVGQIIFYFENSNLILI